MPAGARTPQRSSAAVDADRTQGASSLSWLAALAALALGALPGHAALTRGPVVTQVAGDGAVVAWQTDRPSGAVLEIDGRALPGGLTRDVAVTVGGLTAGRRYAYSLRAGSRTIGHGTFRAAPGPSAGFRAVVFGDYGSGNDDERAVARLAVGLRPDLLVTTGDNAYPLAFASLLDNAIFRPLRGLLARTAWTPALGNHDYYLTNARYLLDAVHLPGARRWFVQRFGPVAFVVLDSDLPLRPGTAQGRFLRSAARSTQDACFRVAVFHHPPFSPHSEGIAPGLRRDLVPVLEQARFQLALLGHVHWYERSAPIRGVTYVTVGTGGAAIDEYADSVAGPLARVRGTFGALALDVRRGRLVGRFIDVDGVQHDRFELRCG